jgi:hypothetical protein
MEFIGDLLYLMLNIVDIADAVFNAPHSSGEGSHLSLASVLCPIHYLLFTCGPIMKAVESPAVPAGLCQSCMILNAIELSNRQLFGNPHWRTGHRAIAPRELSKRNLC